MLLLYVFFGFVGLFVSLAVFLRLRDYQIRNGRKDDLQFDFVNHFRSSGVSEQIALSVRRHFQDWMDLKDFPVRPNDSIRNVYGIVGEDLDDLIIDIATVNDLEIPENCDYRIEPITTVDDLTRFIATFSKKSHVE